MTNKRVVLPPNFSIPKAHRTQAILSRNIVEEDRLPNSIEFIAGVDVAYTDRLAIGAICVLEINSLRMIEAQVAVCEVKMPYVPALLAFREIPALVACARKLTKTPDAFLVDGHGVAHPYNFGLASHFGMIVGKPTIGVAKTKLIGETSFEGGNLYLIYKGRIVGRITRSSQSLKPLYVSVGHLVSLETATRIVEKCLQNGRMPEPIREAHKVASEYKQQLNE